MRTRWAVGWFGGACGHCTPCRQGDFVVCENLKVAGWSYDGGYAGAVIAPTADALARIPDAPTATDAAPLACAGGCHHHPLTLHVPIEQPPTPEPLMSLGDGNLLPAQGA